MTKRTGVYGIAAIILLFAVLHLGLSRPEAGTTALIATLFGGAAYLLMAISIFLATRPGFLESAFGGLDRMYRDHKTCGVSAAGLVLVHFFLTPKEIPPEFVGVFSLTPSAPLGMLSLIALVLVLAMTLNRKIAYHRWRMPHKLMGFVFILVTVHFLTLPSVFMDRFGPSGLLLLVAGAVGIVAFGYNLFGLNRRTGARFIIEAVNELERATELVLKPVAERLSAC